MEHPNYFETLAKHFDHIFYDILKWLDSNDLINFIKSISKTKILMNGMYEDKIKQIQLLNGFKKIFIKEWSHDCHVLDIKKYYLEYIVYEMYKYDEMYDLDFDKYILVVYGKYYNENNYFVFMTISNDCVGNYRKIRQCGGYNLVCIHNKHMRDDCGDEYVKDYIETLSLEYDDEPQILLIDKYLTHLFFL